jgi:two-component system, NtrC family, sensor kinase
VKVRRTKKPKARKALAGHAFTSGYQERVSVLTRELSEALEHQTATSEVLRVVSSSHGELKPVFEAMLAYAVQICGAKFGTLFLCQGDAFRAVAQHNTPPALAELRQREPVLRVGPGTSLYRSKKTRQPVQIADLTAEPAYFERDQNRVAIVELGGYRAVLSVPMVRANEVIGAINVYRQDAGTFLDKQVELLKNFAKQAVIAIENARLLNELRQRTGDLSEALEQQTATSDVLKVISSSPGELEPVFKTILQNATRICSASFGNLYLHDEDYVNLVASHNMPPAFANARRGRRLYSPPESICTAGSLKQKKLFALPILPPRRPISIATNLLWKPSNLVACGPELWCLS